MKIIHTSDWHLGRIIYGQSLIDDQRYFIEKFFYPLLDSEKPDAVIIAGDLFDRQIAPAEALRLFDSCITEICGNMHIPIIAISGNHDGADRLGLGARLLDSSGFHICSRLDASAEPVVLSGKHEIHIYSLPYFDPAMARDYLKNDDVRGFGEAYAAVLEIIGGRLDPAAFNMLVAHCFITGAEVSDSESPLFIGGSGELDPDMFSRFDYVALGHLHRAQKAGKNGRYSGSPLKYSFDEEHHKKSVTILEIEDSLNIREVPVIPRRDMRVISGSISELEAAAELSRDDYIFAQIEGAPVYEPMHRLRKTYPNTLGIRNGSELGAASENEAVRRELKISAPGNIFDEFIRQMCGSEPTDADREIFAEAFDKASGGGAE